jgi:hypothetical protein
MIYGFQPNASSLVNTIYMTVLFAGGAVNAALARARGRACRWDAVYIVRHGPARGFWAGCILAAARKISASGENFRPLDVSQEDSTPSVSLRGT